MSAIAIETMFASLSELRAEHRRLQKEHRAAPHSLAVLEDVEAFIRRGVATGAILDDEAEQSAAQSLLDFWATTLYRADRPVPESTLAPFDPTLSPKLEDDVVPYVGLDAFAEQKSEMFFGRSHAIAQIVRRLHNENLVAVIGPSGSGKSSLVLAGVLPALNARRVPGSDTWKYLGRMVPGCDPLASLERVLREAAGGHPALAGVASTLRTAPEQLTAIVESCWPSTPTVLVIDQFEELSTITEDADARAAFERAIAHFVSSGDVRHIVLVTMRSDFIGAVARQPELQAVLETALEHVTPLSAAELREAIERPAQAIGLKFEHGVVEALVHDILGEPAALPLLQFTLLKLWERRKHNRVTMDTYRELGGGRLALTQTADRFMASLIPEDRVMAERIFLQLVRPGTGQDYVAKRVRRVALFRIGPAERVDRVLDKLAHARLIRLTGRADGEQEVEIAHEALGRNWQHLINLLERDREQMDVRRRFELQASEWMRLGRGEAGLLNGAALVEASAWMARPGAEAFVSDEVRELVESSRAAADASLRRQRAAKAALVVLTAASLAFAAVAWQGRLEAMRASDEARQARDAAVADRSRVVQLTENERLREEARRVEVERRAAADASTARQFALQAQQLREKDGLFIAAQKELLLRQQQEMMLKAAEAESANMKGRLYDADRLTEDAGDALNDDPERATLLALQAVMLLQANHQAVPQSTQQQLYQAVQTNRLRAWLGAPPNSDVLAFSPDSQRAVTSDGQSLALWDLITRSRVGALPIAGGRAAAFSLDSRQLAVASAGVAIFDATTGVRLQTLAGAASVDQLAFSPDGRFLAGAGPKESVHLWMIDSPDPTVQHRLLEVPRTETRAVATESIEIRAFAFSPTGAFLVTAATETDRGGTRRERVRVWETESASAINSLDLTRAVNDLAFHPDGMRVVVASEQRVRVWRPFAPAGTTAVDELALATPVEKVVVAPDGSQLVAFGGNVVTPIELMASLRTGPRPTAANARPSVSAILSSMAQPESVRLSAGSAFSLPVQAPSSVRFSPDATLLATATDNGISVWNVQRGSGILLANGLGVTAAIATLPDDRYVTASSGGALRVWSLADAGGELRTLYNTKGGTPLALSADGSRAAISCEPNCVQLHDIVSQQPATIIRTGEPIAALALTREGRLLATASSGATSTIRLWNTTTGISVAAPRTLAGPLFSLAFSPDGTRLAAVAGNVHLFHVRGEELLESTAVKADAARLLKVAFSPDGTLLATAGSDRNVRLWHVASGTASTLPPLRHVSAVRSIAFTHDSTGLATGAEDGTVRLWSLAGADAGANLLTVNASNRPVTAVTVTAGGSAMLVASDDGSLRRFPAPLQNLLPWALSQLTRPLQPDECRADGLCERLPRVLELVVAANRLARQGDVPGAAANYQKAVALEPSIKVDSRTQAARIASDTAAEARRQQTSGIRSHIALLAAAGNAREALTLSTELPAAVTAAPGVNQIEQSARTNTAHSYLAMAQIAAGRGDRKNTETWLRQAKAVLPELDLDIPTETINMLNTVAIRQLTSLVNSSNITAAVALLEQLRKDGVTQTPFDTNAADANRLCWRGSLLDLDLAKHPEIRRACATTVRLTDGRDANFRDSRGLNAARNGDYATAIEDFKAFIADEQVSREAREQRKVWVEALQNGTDPFTEERLRSVR